MRKGKSSTVAINGNGNPAGGSARTTVFLSDLLNENLDALALLTGLPKGEHVRRALAEYMTQQGFQPDKKPKIKVTY